MQKNGKSIEKYFPENCKGCLSVQNHNYCYIAKSITDGVLEICPCWFCLVKVKCDGNDCFEYQDLVRLLVKGK